MATIDSAYEKKDLEMIAHILDKIPKEYSEVVTMVEAMPSLTLEDLKASQARDHLGRVPVLPSASPHIIVSWYLVSRSCFVVGNGRLPARL
jgi:hypothetical protein